MKILRLSIAIAIAATCFPGCASWFDKESSGSQIYEGDSPNIRYIERESAGGPLGR